MSGARYCRACNRIEVSKCKWHGGDGFYFCDDSYKRLLHKYPNGIAHPSWGKLADAVADRDNTRCLISHAAGRADVQALRAVGAMCRGNRAWAGTQQSAYLVGFALQFYYSWPMTTLCALAFRRVPSDTGVEQWMEMLAAICCMYADLKLVDGNLVAHSAAGLSVLKNPSERRSGSVTFYDLAQECEKWRDCCVELARLLVNSGHVRILDLLRKIKEAKLSTYSGAKDYRNVRLCRALVVAHGCYIADIEENWVILAKQSGHITDSLQKLGLLSFSLAMKFRDALRVKLGMPDYCLNDLIIFVCLVKGIGDNKQTEKRTGLASPRLGDARWFPVFKRQRCLASFCSGAIPPMGGSLCLSSGEELPIARGSPAHAEPSRPHVIIID